MVGKPSTHPEVTYQDHKHPKINKFNKQLKPSTLLHYKLSELEMKTTHSVNKLINALFCT